MTDRLTPEDVAWTEFIAKIEAGILRPEFVNVPNGHYTKRVVHDEIVVRSYGSTEAMVIPVETVEWRYEPCHVPRYRQELRYIFNDD